MLGKTYVPRLLGDVDLHDAAHERMPPRAAEVAALQLIDRYLTRQDVHEKELGKRSAEARDGAPEPALQKRHLFCDATGSVHEFLEHQRVLTFFDHLVIGIPKVER